MDLTERLVERVLIKLGKLLIKEVKLQTGLRKKITCLSDDLKSMHTALRKVADVPPDQLDDQVKLWVCEVRELSYDVEDTLDIFLVRVEGHESRDPNRFKRAAKKISKLFNKSKARHELDGMIKIINKRAQEIHSRRVNYKVDNIVAKRSPTSDVDPRLEAMYVKVSQLVGIEKSSGVLIDKLSLSQGDEASNTRMKIVSLVGIGGLGKTTLANAVYENLKPRFNCGAFVSIGRNRDSVKEVFVDILIELDKAKYMDYKYKALNDKQLIHELHEFLGSKRYLIVIDDIWETKCWEVIKLALVENNTGSRIITTTRNADVGLLADEVYNLERLPCDKSKQLFYTRLFGEAKCPDNQTDMVSDNILKKCDGVPLAIITMASLLVGKSREQWLKLCNSIGFRDTNRILSLSYYDLPPHLKSCLLYLSAYPEDYLIRKDHLIWMWVAEGFIVDKEPGTGLFEVGEGYFNELTNRSMIQAVESDYGTIDACRIHDMVLDLIRVKSWEENFFTISADVDGTSSTCRVRRLSYQKNGRVEQTPLDITHIRTFINFMPWWDTMDFKFMNFKLLRVLYLKVRDWEEANVENLLHLRYLRTSYKTPKLQGIGALKFLQILDFKNTDIKELPSSIRLLRQLICLRVGEVTVPNGVIEKLTSLQELRIKVEDDTTGQFVMDLGNLFELRVLRAGIRKSIVESNLVDTLGKLHKLQHLKVEGDITEAIANEAIWNAAVLPRPLQHFVTGDIMFPVIPSCINPSDLPNLTHLKLNVLRMNEQNLRILARLPELRHLELCLISTLTINVDADDDGFFEKLISLSLPDSFVYFALNENTPFSFNICYWYHDNKDEVTFGSAEKGEECIVHAPGVMPNLQLLHFTVGVKALVRKKGSCDRLGFQYYLPSLEKVKVDFWCDGAYADDVEREEAALRHAIEAHPNRPTLEADLCGKHNMKSRGLADDTEEEGEVGSLTDDVDVHEKEEGTDC